MNVSLEDYDVKKLDSVGRDGLLKRIQELVTYAGWAGTTIERLRVDNAQLNTNVTDVQTRCTALLEENRALKASRAT